MTSEQMIKHRAQSVDIRRVGELVILAQRLFRGHVTRRSQRFNCASDGTVRFSQPCQAEVGKVWFAICIEQNVSGLYVSLENPAPVRVMNRPRKLSNQFRRAADRHRLALKEFVERAALNEFHAEVARPITLADFINGNDIRIIQTRRSFRFQPESLKAPWCGPLASLDNL